MRDYKISGSIVVYNKPQDARKTVESVLDNTGEDFTLYVIDNTEDGHINRDLAKDYSASYIYSHGNIGFGKAHNSVLDKLDSKYHMVINPDILINSDTVDNLCRFMDSHPEVAIACPKVLNPDGTVQLIAKRRPGLLSLVSRRVHLPFLKKIERDYLMADCDPDVRFPVEFCTGCFFIIRTEVFRKIGGFDEDYFLYFEDADITMKARKEGLAYYAPCARVVHFWHRETAHDKKQFMIQLKSMFIYFKKWGFRLR